MNVKRILSALLISCLLLTFFSCDGGGTAPDITTSGITESDSDAVTTEAPETLPTDPDHLLNGTSISRYTIVYSETAPDYNLRAAEYIREAIEERTGLLLPLVTDETAEGSHEIVVGETNRAISTALNAETEQMQFALLAEDGKIAIEGDFFKIAAAAYYFVETYLPEGDFASTVPETVTICEPIVEEATNFIFLIGDGMGFNQTRLFETYDVPTEGSKAYSDGEDIFYGYYFSAIGQARTDSLDGVTDSAAAGTALATGFKTTNGRIGKDSGGENLTSLTELAASLGKATAVMSTETSTGATPGSFSAHAFSREEDTVISAGQQTMKETYGTVISCGFNHYTAFGIATMERKISDALNVVSQDEDGFFLMYEEAYIDKHCHNNLMPNAFNALVRFNQAIGRFMEFAFYHPDTFVVITADHETGGLTIGEDNSFSYTTGSHTGANVPVFAYGYGAEVFNGETIENTQIPITLADMMGIEHFGDLVYTSLLGL